MKRLRGPEAEDPAELEVPVVVRGALSSWPSLGWGEERWLEVLGKGTLEVRE